MILKPPRPPKNGAEGKVWDYLKAQGWNITKRGWPDFFCWKDDPFPQVLVVEVKRQQHHRLKGTQYRIFQALKRHGIKVVKMTPEDLGRG